MCGAREQGQCTSNNKVPEIDGEHGFRGDCVSNQAVAQVAIAVSAMKIVAVAEFEPGPFFIAITEASLLIGT